jgi:hypothetical protein
MRRAMRAGRGKPDRVGSTFNRLGNSPLEKLWTSIYVKCLPNAINCFQLIVLSEEGSIE